MYEKLRDSYPNDPSVAEPDAAHAGGAGRDSNAQVVLSTVDNLKQVRFGESTVSVVILAPYNGWDEFKPRIRQAIAAFMKVTEPTSVSRIRMRYRNLIRIPGESFYFNEYFNISLNYPDEIPKLFSWHYNGLRADYKDNENTSLQLIFSSADSDGEGRIGTLLDIAAIRRNVHEPMAIGAIMKIINDLKLRVSNTFESMITDKTRALFNGG